MRKKKPGPIDAEIVTTEKGLQKAERNQSLIPMPTVNIESLIEKALLQNANIETIERLVALSERMRAQWAKQRYTEAHAKFQLECGSIIKSHPVFKKTCTPAEKKAYYASGDMSGVQYMYAPFEDILEQATPALSRNGFSHSFKMVIDPKEMTLKAICFLRHVDGHTEPEDPNAPDSGFTVPIGSDYMSKQQMFGSAGSFAKRYAFLNTTGLQPKGEDNDGQTKDGEKDKGGGGKDHRYKSEPQSKSGRKAEGTAKTTTKSDAGERYPEIKRASNDSTMIARSTVATVTSTMKRHKITEEEFSTEFGFPIEQLDKTGMNSTLDWIKEHE